MISFIAKWGVIILVIIPIGIALFASLYDMQTRAPTLLVTSWNCERVADRLVVQGTVKNTGERSLANVMAIGEFRTGDGVLVGISRRALDRRVLLPGEPSSFVVESIRDMQGAQSCGIRFQSAAGETLQHIEGDT